MLPLVAAPTRAFQCRGSQYLSDKETTIVANLIASVRPRVVFEFGCNTGRTAKSILDHVPSIELYVGIDVPADHKPMLACQRFEVPRIAGLFARNEPRFSLLLRDSRTIIAAELEPCDAVFIDGDHSAEGVEHDSRIARELVRPGGIIVWHDYGNEAVEVTGVLDLMHSSGFDLKHVEGSWVAFLRR